MNGKRCCAWRRVVARAVCGVGIALGGCSGSVELMGSIPEAEANEVIGALLNAGIEAGKVPGKEGMVGVRVEQAQVAQAVDTLRALGLPRARFAGMGEVFRKEGLISSPTEERARYLFALSQELSNTLSHIDGVLVARVHLVLPERSSSGDPQLPSSASVFLKYRAETNVPELQPQVRRLVVNSIPGLATEKVSVVLVPSSYAPASRQTAWTRVLGFRVEAASATALATALVVLALVTCAALGAAGYLGWRFRLQLRRSPPASQE